MKQYSKERRAKRNETVSKLRASFAVHRVDTHTQTQTVHREHRGDASLYWISILGRINDLGEVGAPTTKNSRVEL